MWFFHRWQERRRALTAMQQDLAYIRRTVDDLVDQQEATRMDLSKLQAAVAQETAIDQSAVVLIQQIADALKATNGDQAAVDALADQLSASASTLAGAVTANTPAAPAAAASAQGDGAGV
jgi:chromosome segregation ATPase